MCWCSVHYWIEKCTVKQWNTLLLLCVPSKVLKSPHQLLSGWKNQEHWDGRGMWHVWGRANVYSGYWGRAEGKMPHGGTIIVDLTMIFKRILEKQFRMKWTWFVSSSIRTNCELLWKRQWNFGLCKIREISWLTGDLLASQVGLCSELDAWLAVRLVCYLVSPPHILCLFLISPS